VEVGVGVDTGVEAARMEPPGRAASMLANPVGLTRVAVRQQVTIFTAGSDAVAGDRDSSIRFGARIFGWITIQATPMPTLHPRPPSWRR